MNLKLLTQLILCLTFFGLVLGCSRTITNPASPRLPAVDTPTFTPTSSFTNTPINTPTYTSTKTWTPPFTATSTFTWTMTSTNTYIPTSTYTPVNTSTNTPPSYTATPTSTNTFTSTKTNTYSPTTTFTFTNSMTSTSTITPSSPTPTPSPTMSYTPTNTATSIATALDTAPALNLSSGVTTLTTGIYYFSCVHISAGAVVTISGGVTIMTECFTLDAGATITGLGNGYQSNGSNYGPGEGTEVYFFSDWPLSSGAGHGGAGGTDHDLNCVLAPGGLATDDPIHPSQMGSASVENCTGITAGGGGALLQIVVYDPIANILTGPATINGTIDMSAKSGSCPIVEGADGGGAGGTILIEANIISGNGFLIANGAGSMGTSGAGGGGGIISLIENQTTFPGTIRVLGMPGSRNATSGCIPPSTDGANGIVTFTAAPSSGY
jgi:hypothetical protein